MELSLDYAVTYKDFCESLHQYRRRSHWAIFVYYLYVWILPRLGALVVIAYLYGLATKNRDITELLDWLALIGLIGTIGLPTLYNLKIRQAYKQRIALSDRGKIHTEVNETGVRFVIQDKVDVRYEWDAFSDFSEAKGFLTLFVKKAAFHTISGRDLTEGDWTALTKFVATHIRRI